MARCLLVVPTGSGVGLTSVGLGLVRALDRQGVRPAFVRAVDTRSAPDWTGRVLQDVAGVPFVDPLPRAHIESLLAHGDEEQVLEEVIALVQQAAGDAEVIVVEGVVPVPGVAYATRLNVALANALDAEVVMVGLDAGGPQATAQAFDIATQGFGHRKLVAIVNRVRSELVPQPSGTSVLGPERLLPDAAREAFTQAFGAAGLKVAAVVPHIDVLSRARVADVATGLDARVVHAGDGSRRVARVVVCAGSVRTVLSRMASGSLAIVPCDRHDVLAALGLATVGGLELAGIVLSVEDSVDPIVLDALRPALDRGLPVMLSGQDSYDTALAVRDLAARLGPEDSTLAQLAMDVVANHVDPAWIRVAEGERRMTTAAFRYALIERARTADACIVLPEGDEPRTLAAARTCARRGIARCVLLGDVDVIQRVAREEGVDLPDSVEILNPAEHIETYVEGLMARRAHKGLTQAQARDILNDRIVLGTMMVAEGHCDGLVSGAAHSTAHTIRPALQLIRTAPSASIVSSVLFMCLPEQVLVYGDCAVNPNPTAEQLAEIALQSADSAAAFGIEPRVAMISYSTGASGTGADVDKVVRATAMAKALRPDLLIDGPLQYDAAAIASVGRSKAPDSPVAGRATVFVFPDLNTGNTTYKAVQRSANVVSMGPLLQGMAKPVNDLSRGALVEDIVFTIALTAVQAGAMGAAEVPG